MTTAATVPSQRYRMAFHDADTDALIFWSGEFYAATYEQAKGFCGVALNGHHEAYGYDRYARMTRVDGLDPSFMGTMNPDLTWSEATREERMEALIKGVLPSC